MTGSEDWHAELSWGLMVWTLITFGIAVFVLRRYAFGPLQT